MGSSFWTASAAAVGSCCTLAWAGYPPVCSRRDTHSAADGLNRDRVLVLKFHWKRNGMGHNHPAVIQCYIPAEAEGSRGPRRAGFVAVGGRLCQQRTGSHKDRNAT